jgi:protein O-GlcNAc transferase
MVTISKALTTALAHHQAGRLSVAEKVYRQILDVEPNHADALHLLGVLASQVHNEQAALDLIGRAIRVNPTVAAFHCNLGLVYHELKKLDEAVASYQRALDLKPDYAKAHSNLGLALQVQG